MTEAREYQLGIDLGTTYTAAAVARGRAVQAIQLTPDAHSMPSVVALRDDGTTLVGEAAMRRALAEPTRVGREFKRRFGDAAPIVLGGARTSAEALTTALLREVLERVQQVEGAPPSRVTLTHPAAWGPFRLDKLRAVAADAGIEQVDLLPEPVAAALANADRLADGSLVVVYDLGGGTFDAAVVKVGENRIVGTPEGVERLGGIDIDALVMAHVDDATGGLVGEADIADPDVRSGLARLADDCRIAKEALSADSETDVNVSLPTVRSTVRLTRAELEAMVRPRLEDSLAALDRTVASAGASWDDIATVLLVGGSSRMPLVAQVVRQHTGRTVTTATNPHLAIALGAAHHAAASAQEESLAPALTPTAVTAAPADPPGTSSRPKWPMLVGAAAVVAGLVVAGLVAFGGGDDSPSGAATTMPITAQTGTSPVTSPGTPLGTTASTAPGTTPATAAPGTPREVNLSVGDASLTATECIDTTGLVARSTAIDVEGQTLAAIVDGDLYVLALDTGSCTVTAPADEVSGLVRNGETDYSAVTIIGDLLVVGGDGGGAIIDRTSGAGAECDLLRSTVNRTLSGDVATYDSSGKGYDELTISVDGCTLKAAERFPNYGFYAIAASSTNVYLGVADGANLAVVGFRGNNLLWIYGGANFDTVDGLATCGGFVCLLDATGERLIVLTANKGAEVGAIDTADLAEGTPQRLNPAGDGWLTIGEPGEIVLLQLSVA